VTDPTTAEIALQPFGPLIGVVGFHPMAAGRPAVLCWSLTGQQN